MILLGVIRTSTEVITSETDSASRQKIFVDRQSQRELFNEKLSGIRETGDELENMGIERSRQAARNAQIVISLLERGHQGVILDFTPTQTVIKAYNKADLLMPDERMNIIDGICISAKHCVIEPLKKALVRAARESMNISAVMLSNARHYEAIARAHDAIIRVQEGLKNGLSGELLSLDLQDCLSALGEVTGQITNKEVLSNIFSKFCIGK